MSMLRGSPLRHRILFVLAVPLGAGLLSALGHLVQRRHGRPTSVSESLKIFFFIKALSILLSPISIFSYSLN